MRKNRLFASVIGALLLFAVIATAQKPVKNVSPADHPNAAAAQQFSQQAFQKIVAARRPTNGTWKATRNNAKELLQQVNNELRAVATAANKNAK